MLAADFSFRLLIGCLRIKVIRRKTIMIRTAGVSFIKYSKGLGLNALSADKEYNCASKTKKHQ